MSLLPKSLKMLPGLLLLSVLAARAADVPYRTAPIDDRIRTLQVYRADSWEEEPVIGLDTDRQVLIAFDEMSHDFRQMGYRLLHCDARWMPSGLHEMEYMEGFSENEFPEGQVSQGTLVEYTHYELMLPNDDVRLKLSGNYAVEIFDRDDPQQILACACFSVLDARFTLNARVNAQTDRGYNERFQQVEFELYPSGNRLDRPDTDLKVVVRQNRRRDTEVWNVQPLMTGADRLVYRHRPELVFEGGNEYRRFDISNFKLAGYGVDRLEFRRPLYHAFLWPDQPRVLGYTYDQDQNGRYLVRARQAFDDSRCEADYLWVHFSLPMPQALPGDGGLYLLGDLTDGRPGQARMTYNADTRAYEQELLLKQGAYNYLYVWRQASEDAAGNAAEIPASRVEGSYWNTGNEYQIYVYYRPFGADYDALCGYVSFSSASTQ